MIKFLKIIFTWWNGQTIGTFLNTLFFGKLVGIDDSQNNIMLITTIEDGLSLIQK